ncbi:MAG: hypothetical protein SNJ74_03135 [Fimbriimonadaceae bacterium]
MSTTLRAGWVFVLAAVLAVAALAQQPAPPTISEASAPLVGTDAVQKELKITAAQKAAIQKAFATYEKGIESLNKEAPKNQQEAERLMQRAMTMRRTMSDSVMKALNAQQRARLRQIGLQFYGIFASLSPDVSEQLKLTEAQRNRIRQAQEQFFKEAMKLQQQRQQQLQAIPLPKNRDDQKEVEAYRKRVTESAQRFAREDQRTLETSKKKYEAQALAALTPAQRAQWTGMLGPAFDFPRAG